MIAKTITQRKDIYSIKCPADFVSRSYTEKEILSNKAVNLPNIYVAVYKIPSTGMTLSTTKHNTILFIFISSGAISKLISQFYYTRQ